MGGNKWLDKLAQLESYQRLGISPEWIDDYKERAAILEFDGRLPREKAELHAAIETRELLIRIRNAGQS